MTEITKYESFGSNSTATYSPHVQIKPENALVSRLNSLSWTISWELLVRTIASFGSEIAAILPRQLGTIWSHDLHRHGNVASLVTPGDSHGVVGPLLKVPRRVSFVTWRGNISSLNICIGPGPATESVLSQPYQSDVIGLPEYKGVVACLGRQEKSLVDDRSQVRAQGLTVEVMGIVDQQAVGSSIVLRLLAFERDGVIFCEWRRLDGAPG